MAEIKTYQIKIKYIGKTKPLSNDVLKNILTYELTNELGDENFEVVDLKEEVYL